MNEYDDLFLAARRARDTAYAPYSHFPVGAALRSASGAIYAGCNVENAAFPVGVCAEASAISAMVAAGERIIVAILVTGADGSPSVAPCGACRQRIAEFAGPDTRVILAARTGFDVFRCDELLPHAFGPNALSRAAGKDDV